MATQPRFKNGTIVCKAMARQIHYRVVRPSCEPGYCVVVKVGGGNEEILNEGILVGVKARKALLASLHAKATAVPTTGITMN